MYNRKRIRLNGSIVRNIMHVRSVLGVPIKFLCRRDTARKPDEIGNLGAFSAKMPLFSKQSTGLFGKFTPKGLKHASGGSGALPLKTPQAF